jgi:superfamily I DNA/RNA helicase
MGKQAFKLIRQMIPGGDQAHDIFIVGDAHQRIYDREVVLSHCGINIVGRGRKLRVNYRTTEENRKWAVRLLQGVEYDDLDGGTDDQEVYKSLMSGEEPRVETFDSFSGEAKAIAEYLRARTEAGEALRNTCIIARTKSLLDNYDGVIRGEDIETYRIRADRPEDRTAEGVRMATMHRAKGLEFDRVIIAGVKEGEVPNSKALAGADDGSTRKKVLKRERSLLYVSATRAKREVIVTCHDEPSHWLRA